jgi:DNA ligase (NAD+)
MDIEGLGEAVVDQLVSTNLINNIADLYPLDVNDLLPLEKFAQKSSENLIQAIESSKKCELWRLIHGLGIQHIGSTASKDLARSLQSLQMLIDANEDELMELDGIGEIMAKSVNHFFSQDSNKEIIWRLIGYGLNVEDVVSTQGETHDFSGKSFVLTGSLASLTREAATQLIENAGGRVTTSVSKKTDFILAGESAGSKLAQAQKLGTKIMDENEFQELLKR